MLLMHFVMFDLIVMVCPCICGILTPSLALEGYGVIRSLWMMLLQKVYRSFSSGKVQISTKIFGAINVEINLEVDGRLYSIHAVEEQVGSNNMMWAGCICKCKERDSPKSENFMQGKNKDHECADDSTAEDEHRDVVDQGNHRRESFLHKPYLSCVKA